MTPKESLPPQRWAPDPPPALEPLKVGGGSGWTWSPDPAKDIAAITWAPGCNEAGSDLALESEEYRDERENRRLIRSHNGKRRLREMRCNAERPEGVRYAAVLLYVHGERSAELNKWESCAAETAKRFASSSERKKLKSKMDSIQFGVRITGAAETAYVEDRWFDAVEGEPAPGPREAKWQAASERIAAHRAAVAAEDAALTAKKSGQT